MGQGLAALLKFDREIGLLYSAAFDRALLCTTLVFTFGDLDFLPYYAETSLCIGKRLAGLRILTCRWGMNSASLGLVHPMIKMLLFLLGFGISWCGGCRQTGESGPDPSEQGNLWL